MSPTEANMIGWSLVVNRSVRRGTIVVLQVSNWPGMSVAAAHPLDIIDTQEAGYYRHMYRAIQWIVDDAQDRLYKLERDLDNAMECRMSKTPTRLDPPRPADSPRPTGVSD